MIRHFPTVASTMSPFPHAVDINESLCKAHAMMSERGIHHLPVTEEGRIVGMLSSAELRQLRSPFAQAEDTQSDLLVKDVCNTRVIVVDIHDRLDAVLLIMAERHADAVAVTRHDKLAGILTQSDVLRKFADVIEALRPVTGGDDAA